MSHHNAGSFEQLQRELTYYRRECHDLGASLLRLQEERSQACREALRSRTMARLAREAYRVADGATSLEEVGSELLDVIADNAMCDRAAFLAETTPGSGAFAITCAVGLPRESNLQAVHIPNCPAFFFTTAQTPIGSPAYELTSVLRLPYLLWTYDKPSGKALILGNQSESGATRPFDSSDQALAEGALAVYLDVLARKQAELQDRRARKIAEETVHATAEFLASAGRALRRPLNTIVGCSEKMVSGSRYPLTVERCAEFADRINESGNHVLVLVNSILQHASFAKATVSPAPDWRPLREMVDAVVGRGTVLGQARGVQVNSAPALADIELLVEPDCFEQVLETLVGNAVRASPDAGRVHISARLHPDRSLEIGVQCEPLQNGDDAPDSFLTNPAGDLAGIQDLGLRIMRAMVEGHDGRLTLHGEPPHAITVALPAHRVRAAQAPDRHGGTTA